MGYASFFGVGKREDIEKKKSKWWCGGMGCEELNTGKGKKEKEMEGGKVERLKRFAAKKRRKAK